MKLRIDCGSFRRHESSRVSWGVSMVAFRREDAPLFLAGAAAVCSVVSIAAFEILMAVALVAILIARQQWRIPPIWAPLALFIAGTVLSAVVTGHLRDGWPQIKKFYVYLMLFLVTTAFQSVRQVRWLAMIIALAATLSAAWGLSQFVEKYQDAEDAHKDFYLAYVGDRITGFMDHWMTFSGEMMMALLLIAAIVFFSRDRRGVWWLAGAGAIIGVALIAAETRSMWFATAAGAIFLLWFWHRWALIALPVMALALVLINPFGIGDRAISIFRPHGDTDSNAHRSITRRIGYKMIAAHPWFGIGPEQVGKEYMKYLPPDTPMPLPTGYYGHLHNIYIHYAAELGIPAALAMTAMFARALFDFARALRRGVNSEARWVLLAAIAVTIGILAGGLFEKNIGDSEVLAMFLAILGCGYVAVREVETCKV